MPVRIWIDAVIAQRYAVRTLLAYLERGGFGETDAIRHVEWDPEITPVARPVQPGEHALTFEDIEVFERTTSLESR